MIKAEVGQVVCWGETIMLIVDHVMTNGGEKWLCLVLDPDPTWVHTFPAGSLTHFRDIDFTERLA